MEPLPPLRAIGLSDGGQRPAVSASLLRPRAGNRTLHQSTSKFDLEKPIHNMGPAIKSPGSAHYFNEAAKRMVTIGMFQMIMRRAAELKEKADTETQHGSCSSAVEHSRKAGGHWCNPNHAVAIGGGLKAPPNPSIGRV